VAKLKPYKFVNPGLGGKSTLAVAAAKKQTLALNRLGASVYSVSTVIKDLEKVSILRTKNEKEQEILERRKLRRERDAAAEEKQEASKAGKSKIDLSGKSKKIAQKSLGFLEKFFGPIGSVLLKVGTFLITKEILEWVADKKNIKKLTEFLRKTEFVFKKIFGWAAGFTKNVLDGIAGLADPNGDFATKLGAIGTLMKGIIGLKYLMNPFSLITDILGILDLIGNKKPTKPGADKGKTRSTRKGSSLSPDGKPASKVNVNPKSGFTGIEDTGLDSAQRRLADKVSKTHGANARAAFDNRYNQLIKEGVPPSAAARRANADVNKLIKAGKITSRPALGSLSTQANKRIAQELAEKGTQEGAEAAAKLTGSKIFGRGVDKATQRFILKLIGKGGVKWLTKTFNRIPVIGPLLTFAFNWAAGEPFLKAAVRAVGAGIGELLGGWAGGAIGALGGPAAPITVPLGGFLGAMLGGLAGEALGGFLYDAFTGKADLGKSLGALGKKAMSGLKKLWEEYIMNGDFWAGAWQTFLNVGGQIMQNTWSAMQSLWSFASGQMANFAEMIMNASKPWRQAVWNAFEKYVLNGPGEIVNLMFDTLLAGAKGVGKLFTEGGPILIKIIEIAAESAITWAFNKIKGMLTGWNPGNFLGKIGELTQFVGAPLTLLPELMGAVGKGVSKKVGEALEKAQEIGETIIQPIKEFIDPAVVSVQRTWEMVSNLGGWVKKNAIDPVFNLITGIWNSGPKIWEWLNRPNTFQEVTGQDVPEEEMMFGGIVKGISNAVSSVGSAIGGALNSPVGKVLGTAASFIPGAAPIMAGINTLATGNPMSMLGMIPGVNSVLSGPLGQIGSQLLNGNFLGAATSGLGMISPAIGQLAGSIVSGGTSLPNIVGNVAQQFGVGGLYKAMTGAFGSGYEQGIRELAGQVGVDPRILGAVEGATNKAMSSGGLSAEYAMQSALEFIPVPVIIEKLVPLPSPVPINTGSGSVVPAVPSSLTQRSQ